MKLRPYRVVMTYGDKYDYPCGHRHRGRPSAERCIEGHKKFCARNYFNGPTKYRIEKVKP